MPGTQPSAINIRNSQPYTCIRTSNDQGQEQQKLYNHLDKLRRNAVWPEVVI